MPQRWLNGDVKLTKVFRPEQYGQALESWRWLDLGGKAPLFASTFGDVFFRSPDGFWWLDILEGKLTRPWGTAEQVQAALNSRSGQSEYLLAELAQAAAELGITPADDEVYDFTTSPVLGGAIDPSNIGVIDFAVGVNIAGQLHEQVRDLPPGRAIAGVVIDDDGRIRLRLA